MPRYCGVFDFKQLFKVNLFHNYGLIFMLYYVYVKASFMLVKYCNNLFLIRDMFADKLG